MNELYKVMNEAMYKLVNVVYENKEVYEFLGEEYGALLEDDIKLCVLDFLVRYNNATEDLVELNT
jgi:hypothetical protein